jgi:hypothetical protein
MDQSRRRCSAFVTVTLDFDVGGGLSLAATEAVDDDDDCGALPLFASCAAM